ncbi:MAG: flagellar type III secretion system pore protein FliP [Actinomycetota bacterium]
MSSTVLIALLALLVGRPAGAQDAPTPPTVEVPGLPEADRGIDVTPPAEPGGVNISVTSDDDGITQSVLIVLLLTIVAVAPSILLLMTSFTRFIIVMTLTRQAIGAAQIPPTQVLAGLALFLTFFVMAPVLSEINERALQPLLDGEMSETEALEAGFEPLRVFMLDQTDDGDLRLFLDVSGAEVRPESAEDLSWTVVVPAFVISELRTAFMIGFVIFIPFLVIDLVIASVLMSLGMVMLPPVFISLPIKLLLFILVDGWSLIIGSLVESVNVAT